MKLSTKLSSAILAALTFSAASTISQAQELRDGSYEGVERDAFVQQLQDPVELYMVTYWHSDTPATNRTAGVVTTGNTSETLSCEIVVDWFAQGGQAEGTTTAIVPPREASDHCSRALPGNVTSCNAVRAPVVGFIEGFAIVSTERECISNVAVDARVYHSTGAQDVILGSQDVKVVRLPSGNRGD